MLAFPPWHALCFPRCPLLSRNAIASLAQLRKLQVLRLVALPQDAFWGISALAATAVPLR